MILFCVLRSVSCVLGFGLPIFLLALLRTEVNRLALNLFFQCAADWNVNSALRVTDHLLAFPFRIPAIR